MKKSFFLVVAFLLIVSTSAQAMDARAIGNPTLYFNGTMAECSVTCRGDNTTDRVNATLTLYQGNTVVDSWSGSGTYRVPVSGSCRVTSGRTYKLVLTWSINGRSQPAATTTATCP